MSRLVLLTHIMYTLISIVFLILFIKANTIEAGPLLGTMNDFEVKRYCSTALSEALRLICGGRYNSFARKYPDTFGRDTESGALKRFAADDGNYFRPLQVGPIHECCQRPCGYSELRTYCAD